MFNKSIGCPSSAASVSLARRWSRLANVPWTLAPSPLGTLVPSAMTEFVLNFGVSYRVDRQSSELPCK